MRLQNLLHKFFGLALLIELVMMIILIVLVMTKLMEIELVMTYIDADIGHGDLLL